MTRWLLLALLSASCHQVAVSPASPAAPPAPPPAAPVAAPPAPPPPTTLPLRTEVARELATIKFGMVAVLERGDRRAVVVWPAIRDGKILDDDIVAWVYVRDGAGWRREKRDLGLSHGRGREKVEQALGGAPEHIISRCGLGKNELAAHLERWPRAFADARARAADDEAINAYEELVRAFSLEAAAYSDMLPEILIAGAQGKLQMSWTCDESACQAQATSAKGPETASFALQPCGDGWVLSPPRQ
jgi:hypothetical protein